MLNVTLRSLLYWTTLTLVVFYAVLVARLFASYAVTV